MRIVASVMLVVGLIAACGDDKADIGEACKTAQDCGDEHAICTGEGYCTRSDCDESGCPSGWSCITSKDITTFNLTTSSMCVPSCSSCPAGTSCHPPLQRCERDVVSTSNDAGATCELHEGDSCTTSSTCCDGTCGLDHYDVATSQTTTTCVLACPTSCPKSGWSCHDFSKTAGYNHPSTGEFCLPDVPTVKLSQTPEAVKLDTDFTLTAAATSPAGLRITEYLWENALGSPAGQGPTISAQVHRAHENTFTVKVRDEANQITSATITVVLQ